MKAPTMTIAVQYDPGDGTVTETVGDLGREIRTVIDVRAGLLDAAVLGAVLAELARKGYTVITPEED